MKFEQIVKGERIERDMPTRYVGNRDIVAKTEIFVDDGDPLEVSTVRLKYTSSPSWETMVFATRFPDLDQDNAVDRYSSEEDAIDGHEAMVIDVLKCFAQERKAR